MGERRLKNFIRHKNRNKPLSLLNILKKTLDKFLKKKTVEFSGRYSSWEEAKKNADGYDTPAILEKTKSAMREIVSGKAKFERDSVLLPRAEYPWPLISCLLSTAASSHGRLSVLDFGGALGSSYYQCRPFLQHMSELTWAVVEQKHFVEAGRAEFSPKPVSFYESPAEAVLGVQPNLLLLSSVLPYLPNPYARFRELLAMRISTVLVDRTFFLRRPGERLTVQKVPEWIYPASYPAWFLDEQKFKKLANEAGYRLIAEFSALDQNHPEGEKADAKGFFWHWSEN